MKRPKLEIISREEFDRRLDADNERTRLEALRKGAELEKLEQLLSQYENTLNEIEARLESRVVQPTFPSVLRNRLQELALKTAEMAASL